MNFILFFACVQHEPSLLMAEVGLLLGIKYGFIVAIIGLTTAVTVNGVYYKLKEKDRNISFPLGPYLGIGDFYPFYYIKAIK